MKGSEGIAPYKKQGFAKALGLPRIPPNVKTSIGETIDTRGSRWIAQRNIHGRGRVVIDLDVLYRPKDLSITRISRKPHERRPSRFSDALIHLIVLHIVHYIQIRQPSSTGTAGLLGAFRNFEAYLHDRDAWGAKPRRRLEIEDLSPELYEHYCRHLEDDQPGNARYASLIRGFYNWGVTEKINGFDFATFRRLKRIQTSGLTAGRIAEVRDPIKGALVWEEERQIVAAFEAQLGAATDRSATQLFWETGIRPEAAVCVYLRDLKPTPNPDSWELDVPRVKKGSRRRGRQEYKTYYISAELAEALLSLRKEDSSPDDFLFHWFADGVATGEARKSIARWAADVGLKTIRVAPDGRESPLPLTPYRLRRTLATNMAERGASIEVIADALDDESLAMASVYAANTSTIVEILEATLDRHPAWHTLINLFLGEVELDEPVGLPEVHGGAFNLVDYEKYSEQIGIIGWCQNKQPCRLSPPLSCYRCPHFLASKVIKRHEEQLLQLRTDADFNIGIESDRMVMALVDDMVAMLTLIAKLRAEKGMATKSGLPRQRKLKRTNTTAGYKVLEETV